MPTLTLRVGTRICESNSDFHVPVTLAAKPANGSAKAMRRIEVFITWQLNASRPRPVLPRPRIGEALDFEFGQW